MHGHAAQQAPMVLQDKMADQSLHGDHLSGPRSLNGLHFQAPKAPAFLAVSGLATGRLQLQTSRY